MFVEPHAETMLFGGDIGNEFGLQPIGDFLRRDGTVDSQDLRRDVIFLHLLGHARL